MKLRPALVLVASIVPVVLVSFIATDTSVAGPFVCGDGTADPGEDCDGADLGAGDCISEGFTGGTLACDAACAYDTSACTSVCGDGMQAPDEQCDDGNTTDGDGCSSTCQIEVPCPMGWPPPPTATIDDIMDPSCFPAEWDITDPDDFWNYISWAPPQATNVRPEEMIIGSGLSADFAWALTTGDPRVVIAIIDSGMRWNNTSIRKRIYLNIGELPLPAGSSCGTRPDPVDPSDPADVACWDINGDGRVNVEDFETDPAVTDMNGNGLIDGQDIIWTFSDGVDDDGNAYVDDISGWDTYENDNDPEDDTNFGHGAGRAEEAAASPMDGGDIGVCPNCTLMLVRVADSFLCDSNDFADAVIFSVDAGAAVIGEALGSYNNTTYTMQAMEYAYLSGVYIVASMADETAAHHNFPGANDHGFGVHSIRYDDANGVFPNITTFLNFENCTNFGGQLIMSAPSTSCSSGSTGMTSGAAGLIYSAALATDTPAPTLWNPATDIHGARRLTADEVKGLLTLHADDIDIPEGLATHCEVDADCNAANSERCLAITGGAPVCSAECELGDFAGRCGDPDNFECRLLTLEDTRNCYPDDDDPAGLASCSFTEDCAGGERCREVGGVKSCLAACDDDPGVCGAGETCGRGIAPINQCYPTKFPSFPGWDQHFGYGRVNVRAAIEPIFDTPARIPPEVDIDAPRWFAYLDPSVDSSLDILGRITFRSDLYDSVDYVVEWAPGIQPEDNEWIEITSDTAVTANVIGSTYFDATTLGTLDLGSVDAVQPVTGEIGRDFNQFTVTIRVRVDASPIGGGATVPAEMRKVISVHTDPDLLPGFPLYLGPSGESSPRVLDLDGDGRDEIILADADGLVHAYTYDAGVIGELPGWPVNVALLDSMNPANPDNHLDTAALSGADAFIDPSGLYRSITSTVAVGNLDGSEDGSLEVVVATHEGAIHVFDVGGNEVAGFPVETDPALAAPDSPTAEIHQSFAIASPAIGDVDGDGDLEIVMGAFDSHVYMWHHDGSLDPGFPVLCMDETAPLPEKTQIVSSPALGDLDLDGILDIVIGTNEAYSGDTRGRIYALHGDGNDHAGGAYHEGWPIWLVGGTVNVLPLVAKGVPQSPALADVDGDGTLEIAIHTTASASDIYFADQSGRTLADPPNKWARMNNFEFGPLSTSVDRSSLGLINHPTFADFDQDGQVDLIVGSAGFNFALSFASGGVRISYDHQVSAWNLSEGELEGGILQVPYFDAWPQLMDDFQFFMSPMVADLTGDNLPEAVSGSGSYLLRAWNYLGESPAGWPKFTNGWLAASPTVGDVDGDGMRDVIVSTRDGYLFVWRTLATNDAVIEWNGFHHDPHGSGNYENRFAPPIIPPDPDPDGCCNCRVGGASEVSGSAAGSSAFLVLFGLWLVRRRFGNRSR